MSGLVRGKRLYCDGHVKRVQSDEIVNTLLCAGCLQTGITARDVARLARRRDVLKHLDRVRLIYD